MKADRNGPADTTMMGVVHDALRRDLDRLRIALTTEPPPNDERRVALANHVIWMMDFLHDHHHSEDVGLWSLVGARNPAAGDLLDRMHGDHATIMPGIDLVAAAARRYRVDATGRDDLVEALAELSGPLLDHLRREEDDAMPVVSTSITNREWNDWNQKFNVRGKSLPRLGLEGAWLMDRLDPDRYQILIHEVPAPMRVVLIKGYAARYRRACAKRWGSDVAVGPLATAGAGR